MPRSLGDMTSTADRWQVATRANVPPFHVMDLLAAAHTRQRTHGDLVDLLAGQPSTGAPAPVRAEAVRLLEGTDPLGYTPAVGHPRAARGDRRPPPAHLRRRGRPRRGDRDHREQRRVPAGLPRGVRGRRQGGDGPAGLPLLPQRAHRARHRGGRDPDRAGDPLPADRRAGRRAARPAPAQGARGRQPGQPDRHHAAPERAGRAGAVVRGRAGAADQRRDLPRHRVRRAPGWLAAPGRPAARRWSSPASASTSR